MKLTTATSTPAETNLSGETNTFSIAANGTAFRLLFDGLYSNKIRAVIREICTNAFDSHVDAGCDAMPFDVSLPGAFDNNFRVRDYGVSLNHDHVMHLYTRAFDSTKRDSNTQVGAFGLGSKSPFAYTDRFTVVARLDGRKRTYLAVMEDDSAPTITLLSDVESDEAQGLEVVMPVKTEDFGEFEREMAQAMIGFDPFPSIKGGNIRVKPPVYTSNSGTLNVFNQDALPGSSILMVRQGCVIYPVDEYDMNQTIRSKFGYSMRVVLNMEIGTCAVVGSREALSLDATTKANLKKAINDAIAEIHQEVYERCDTECKTYYDAQVYWFEDQKGVHDVFTIPPKWNGKDVISFIEIPSFQKGADGLEENIMVKVGTSRQLGALPRRYDISQRAYLRFVIQDTSVKTLRSKIRFQAFVETSGGYYAKQATYLLTDPSAKVLKILKDALHLEDSQFIKLDSLPDPGPRKPINPGSRGSTGMTGTIAGVNVVKSQTQWSRITDLPTDFLWFDAGARITNYTVETNWRIAQETIGAGMPEVPVLAFTTHAQGRLKPNGDNEVGKFATKWIADNQKILYKRYKNAHFNAMLTHLTREHFQRDDASAVSNRLLDYTERQKAEREAQAELGKLKEKYPLLFGVVDNTQIKWYIDLCDTNKGRNP